MNKILKVVLLTIAGLAALVLGVIGYIAATFNPNDYKPQIVQLVKEKTSRSLKLEGDIKLSLFPKLGADLGKLSLSEHKSDKEFVAVENVRVFLAFLPLLSKQLVVDEVKIKGARANLVRFKDGATNINDLLGGPGEKTGQFKFDIDHVEIENAAFTLRDEQKGTQIALTGLNLKTGRIAPGVPGKFELGVAVEGAKPKVSARVQLAGNLTFDLDKNEFSFSKLDSKISGDGLGFSGLALELKGDLEVQLEKKIFNAAALQLAATGNYGKDSFDVKLSAPKLQANGQTLAVTAEKLSLTASGKRGADSGNLKLDAAKLDADLSANKLAVESVTAAASGSLAGMTIAEAKLNAPRLQVNLNARQIAAEGVALSASGKRGDENFEIALNAPKLAVSDEKAGGDAVMAKIKLAGAGRSLAASMNLSGVEGSARALTIAKLALDLDAKQGEAALKGNLASPFNANLAAKTFDLPKLAAEFRVTHPAIPQKTVTLPLNGALHADLEKQAVNADISTKFDESSIQAKLGLTRFSSPAYTFDVAIDRLNVDKYFPPKPPDAPGQAEQPIDLSALKGLTASGSVKVGALTVSNVKASNVKLDIKAANGKLDVSPHSANLYQGSVSGSLSVNANNNQMALRQNLANVAIEPLLKDALNKDLLEGKGNVALDVSTAGDTITALKKALNGTAQVNLKDGAMKGINIAQTLRNFKAKLGTLRGEQTQAANRAEKTDFSELTASFTIKNGIAHNEDLSMKSPLLRLSGAGDINIGDDTLNYLAKTTVVATSKGQGGAELESLKGFTVPMRITGPLSAPQYKLDFSAMVSEAAKQKVEEKKEEIKGKVEDKLKDKLKGLFKK